MRGIERAEALPQHQRPGERLLHRDLLVEREADQQRHRVRGDQRIGLVGFGEVQAIGHATYFTTLTNAKRAPHGSARFLN